MRISDWSSDVCSSDLTVTPWREGRSLFTIVHERAAASKREESAIFEPCKAWLAYLTALSTLKNGVRMLDGSHVDSIWRNAYLVDSQCVLIDREWEIGRAHV